MTVTTSACLGLAGDELGVRLTLLGGNSSLYRASLRQRFNYWLATMDRAFFQLVTGCSNVIGSIFAPLSSLAWNIGESPDSTDNFAAHISVVQQSRITVPIAPQEVNNFQVNLHLRPACFLQVHQNLAVVSISTALKWQICSWKSFTEVRKTKWNIHVFLDLALTKFRHVVWFFTHTIKNFPIQKVQN